MTSTYISKATQKRILINEDKFYTFIESLRRYQNTIRLLSVIGAVGLVITHERVAL